MATKQTKLGGDGPDDVRTHSIKIKNKTWDAWQDAATKYDTSVTALIRDGMKKELRQRQKDEGQ